MGNKAAMINQITIHIKSYTASAKFYLALMSIMKHTELDRDKLEMAAKKE